MPMSRNQSIRLALLSLWLGIMGAFSFLVAPIAFAVLSPVLAGNIVSRHLVVTEWAGIGLGGVLLTLCWWENRKGGGDGKGRAEAWMLLSMLGAMGVSRGWVSRTLHQIRLDYGERLQTLPREEPIRQTFDLLHQLSVGLMGWTMLAACLLIGWTIHRTASPPVRTTLR
jgi:hypothetical protein